MIDMRKKYESPEVSVICPETESLLTTFSTGGEVEGPVGAKTNEGLDWERGNSSSIWDSEETD